MINIRIAWKWVGHTLRNPEGNIAKRAREWNPQGKRKRGQPTQMWRHSCFSELQVVGVCWLATKKTALHRNKWTWLAAEKKEKKKKKKKKKKKEEKEEEEEEEEKEKEKEKEKKKRHNLSSNCFYK